MARAAAPKNAHQVRRHGGHGEEALGRGQEGRPREEGGAGQEGRPREEGPGQEGRAGQEGAGQEGRAEEGARPRRRPGEEGRAGQEGGRGEGRAREEGRPAAKAEPAKKPARKPTTVICPLSGFEVKPEKPGLSPRTLEKLKTLLLEERARHVQQADELMAEAEQLANEREGGDTQFDEESGEGDTINIERERDLLLSASAQQTVDEIDRALERMENKTYGLCLPAGRRINLERLEALPYAETCVDCKARAERRR